MTEELESDEEEDISTSEPSFIGGDIVNTFYDYGSVATFNSVYSEENFDLTQEFNYTMNITLDLKKILGLMVGQKRIKIKNKVLFGMQEHCIIEPLRVVIGYSQAITEK